MRTRVKICGFTQVEQAVQAAQLGVDAIGLVFYANSPRYVSIAQAQQIVQALPAFVTVVALFVDEHEARIREVLAQVAIDCLQFHGNEPPSACRLYGKPYLKAIQVHKTIDIQPLSQEYHEACGLLLDAYHPDSKGGTGQVFDWDLIPPSLSVPIILAGGLTVENIKPAVQTVKPYALDVSSGVEISKGVKDVAKMAAFMTEVNHVDRILR
jgi:phosphoribosylanthranilate isomerase